MKQVKDVSNDDKLIGDLEEHARDLRATFAKRDNDFRQYEYMYTMHTEESEWEKQQASTIKKTISPTARDKVAGMVRLLVSQSPVFRASSYGQDNQEKQIEAIESMLSRWWDQAGVVNRKPLHHDMILSLVLYDEAHTAITLMDDYDEDTKNDPRVKRVSDKTPVLFQVWSPRGGYPEFDELGLSAYYRESDDSWINIRRKYGKLLEKKMPEASGRRYGNAKVGLFYDLDYFGVWIDGKCIKLVQHGLPAIPVDVTFGNGSAFFENEEDKRQPVLYSLLRSKLWERENLMLTVIYSQLFAIGTTPLMVRKAVDRDPASLELNNRFGFSMATLKPGESLDIITNKGVLPNEMQSVADMTSRLIDGTTIQNAAFGEKGQGNSTFSETSLLAQSARLPLIGPQRMGGFGISSAVELALMLMKERGISYNKNGITIKPSEIPDDIEIKITLDVVMPHERLQSATIGKMLKDAEFASDEWIMNNVLGITDTDRMKRQINREQLNKLLSQQETQRLLQQLQQKQAQEEAEKQQLLQQASQPQQPQLQPEMAQQPQPEPQAQSMTPADVDNELLNNLYRNARPQMPGQSEAFRQSGLPPQMGGMIPGSGLAGSPNDEMVLQ